MFWVVWTPPLTLQQRELRQEMNYRVIYYPQQKPWFEKLMEDISDNVEARILQAQLGEYYGLYQNLEKGKNLSGYSSSNASGDQNQIKKMPRPKTSAEAFFF